MIASGLVPKYGRRVLETGAIVLAAGYASTVLVYLLPGRPRPTAS